MKSAASLSDEYSTPQKLFDALAARYGPFTLDAAASKSNTKCAKFFSKDISALRRPWEAERVWLNPPYSRGNLPLFVGAARNEVAVGKSGLVCCLVPGHTAEAWWHDHVEWFSRPRPASCWSSDLGAHTRIQMGGWEMETVRIRGRQAFEAPGATTSARFPSHVVVFAKLGMLRNA